LQPGKLCKLAVEIGRKKFSYEEARAALGSISNLYCFYLLEHPDVEPVSVKGFVSDPIATERAVIAEMGKSVSRRHLVQLMYDSLVEAFERMAAGSSSVNIRGFGTFALQSEPGLWTLTLELPHVTEVPFERLRREAAGSV
jgi:hypothetical protein